MNEAGYASEPVEAMNQVEYASETAEPRPTTDWLMSEVRRLADELLDAVDRAKSNGLEVTVRWDEDHVCINMQRLEIHRRDFPPVDQVTR